jgi:hypothetical protein
MVGNQGSTTMRNVPDVALTADNVYVRADGYDYNVGGTSCAAPLWAGFTALVNQQAVGTGKATVGFINPVVYAIGASPNYPSAFHDISTGNNTWSGSPNQFYAMAGYDLCTGWGTPAGQSLINALASLEALIITPASGFSSIGGAGGPFTVTAQSLTLTNAGTNILTWSLSDTSAWLNASPGGGMLTPGGPAATVTVSLNSTASNLVVGSFSATLWFTNLNDGFGQGLQYNLSVISPPTITMQPTNEAVIEGTAASFTVSATGGLPLAYQWQDNGTNLTDGGDVSGSATTNLVITGVSDADVGIYTVTVTNLAGSTTSSNASLTIVPSPPIITVQPASQIAVIGSTATFTVGAVGSTPFFYQWNSNETNLVDATNETLVLTNVQFGQAGVYDVVITNLYGSATSSNAILTVDNVPVITSFSPVSGDVGAVVNISGMNFDPTPGNNVVRFGAVQAVLNAASATNLTVTVPAGATFAPITETVNGLTAYADGPFLPTFPGSGPISGTTLGPQFTLPTGNGPVHVVMADLDGDGKPDLIIGDFFGGDISIYQNLGTNGTLSAASFGARIVLPGVPGSDLNPYNIAVADLDGDGKLDIIVLNVDSDVVSIYRNLSTPGNLSSNSFAARIDLLAASGMCGVAVQDLNGDGKPDIVTANTGVNTISIFQNQSTVGNIAFAPRVDLAAGNGACAVAIGDLDGDGNPDLVVANANDGTLWLFRNLGLGGAITTNSFAPPVILPAPASCQAISIGDMDGDGKLDLVVASGSGSEMVAVYRNTSTVGSLTSNSFAAAVDFPLGGWGQTVALGDLNGDGKPDIAVVSEMNNLLSLFQKQSTPGSFTNTSLAARVDFGAGSNPWGVVIGDLDGDGRPDIVFANTYDNTVSIYQNLTPFGGPPVITQQPINQMVASGNPATFSVMASGSAPLSYQWNFEGAGIIGATNLTLELPDVQPAQAGSYSVLVTNGLGSALSSNAILTVVLAPPLITVQPASLTNNAGTTAAFSVMAGGSLPLAYQWQDNGTNLTDGGDISGSATAELTLANVQDSDVAGYSVAITNVAGSVTSSVANLVVVDPPVILQQPTNLTVNAGGTAVFAVTAGRTVPLSYQWQENGFPLADGGNITGSATPLLTLTSVTLSNMATYSVAVTNAAGSITSSNATLTVTAPATITSQPLNLTNTVGSTAIFNVTAGGSWPLSYQWNFNGTNLAGATDLTLILTNLQPSEAGNYAVAVTNLYGSVLSSNATLTVISVPVITSFNPICGVTGTVVNINGLNFDPTPGNNLVRLGAVQAVVSAASTTNLTVSVPVGATFAPITETVNGLTAYADAPFLPTFLGTGPISSSSLGPQITLPAGSGPTCVAIADLDGDGKPDLVIGDGAGGSISIYQNLGTNGTLSAASFGPQIVLPGIVGSYQNPFAVVVADIDGDGRPDIVAIDGDSDQVAIYRNLSSPGVLTTNSFAAPVYLPGGNLILGLAVQDLNGDGKPDILTANFNDNTISIFQNQSTPGNIAFAPRVDLAAGTHPQGVAIGDLDGDGNPDLAVANTGDGTISVFRNLGLGGTITTNSFAPQVVFSAPATCQSLAIGDVDGDGKLDLVVSGSSGSSLMAVLRNTATPGSITTNSFAAAVDFPLLSWGQMVALGDINGGGQPDIAVVSGINSVQNSALSLFQNQSTPGSFTSSSLGSRVDFGTGNDPGGLAMGDLSGDGRPDVVCVNYYDNTLSIYENLTPFGGPPVIIQQPANQTVMAGGTASFSVVAGGSLPLSYEWNFNGLVSKICG